jgi:hypothetical protein
MLSQNYRKLMQRRGAGPFGWFPSFYNSYLGDNIMTEKFSMTYCDSTMRRDFGCDDSWNILLAEDSFKTNSDINKFNFL